MLLTLVVSGCGIVGEKIETQGYLLKVENERVLFAENISLEEYNEMKELSMEEVFSLETVPNLIYLTYVKANDLNQGDKVSVTISGEVLTSFPSQAKASKIKKVD